MDAQGYQVLEKRVLAHKYRQQETYQIDGTRYVLEKGNAASTERWTLWMYGESQFTNFVAGDSIQEVFFKAADAGIPVEKLTLDQWHD